MTESVATRKDIDEVIDLMRTFMHQVDERFTGIEERIDTYDQKLDKLINTVDSFVARIT